MKWRGHVVRGLKENQPALVGPVSQAGAHPRQGPSVREAAGPASRFCPEAPGVVSRGSGPTVQFSKLPWWLGRGRGHDWVGLAWIEMSRGGGEATIPSIWGLLLAELVMPALGAGRLGLGREAFMMILIGLF